MRAINYLEIKNLAQRLEALSGSQLQNVKTGEDLIEFEFYHLGQSWYLLCDLKVGFNFSFLSQSALEKKYVKNTTPVLLFLRAHAVGHRLLKVDQPLTNDRRLVFYLTPVENPCRVEVVLYSPNQNLIVEHESKKISWNKIKEESASGTVEIKSKLEEVTLEDWKKSRFSLKSAQGLDPALQLKKSVEKKQKALEKVLKDISDKHTEHRKLIEAGEYLKVNLHQKITDLPASLVELVDETKSLAQNMKQIFERAKVLKEKLIGSEQRSKELEKEIQALENTKPLDLKKSQEKNQSLRVSEVQSRVLNLDSGAVAYMGKSATDNLKILRQAKSWDLWLHLRDYPSAHLIIRRHRGQDISQAELEKVVRWFCKESLQAKRELREGDRVEFIVTEVRYVRPIKGSPGLVNYESEKSFTIRY